jgi:DNA-binding winged helix-turn-helix (wHTH) protein
MNTRSSLYFGSFRLDPVACRLFRGERELPLQRQPAMVLALLASRAPEVVRRDELQAHLWGESTHVDFSQGLNYCIRQVRRVLDDSPTTPSYIETLPRIGYRFVAPVIEEASSPRLPNLNRTQGVRLGRVARGVTFAAGSATLAMAAWVFVLHLAGPALHSGASPDHHDAVVRAFTTIARSVLLLRMGTGS